MRGEFKRADGLVIPNNVTRWGAQKLLDVVFNPAPSFSLFMTLVRGTFDPGLLMTDLDEPTIGTNGFARVDLNPTTVGNWNPAVQVDDGASVTSKDVVFEATGGDFDEAIRRVALVDSLDSNVANVFCLSSPLPLDLTITPTTPAIERAFNYTLFL